jgi:glutathione gamma-glutamylcysteinyltransferase
LCNRASLLNAAWYLSIYYLLVCMQTSLSIVLNSLEVDPGEEGRWRGSIWRWQSDTALACPYTSHSPETGINLPDLACIATCSGLDLMNDLADSHSFDAFIRDVRATCTSSGAQALVLNFSRGVLGQSGSGHFSPTGAYVREEGGDDDAGREYVLVLDTASFKYPSYWVEAGLLHDAIRTRDDQGVERGWLTLRRTEAKKEV